MKSIIFWFAFLLPISVFSQNSYVLSDSEYLQLQNKVKSLAGSDVDSAIVYAAKIDKSNNYIHKTFGSGALSYLYQLKEDSIKSKSFYKSALNHLNRITASKEKTRVHSYLLNFGGIADLKRGDLDKALEKFQKGKELSKQIDDVVQVIKFNNNITQINSEIGDFKLAIKTSRESEKLIDKNYYLYSDEEFARGKSNVSLNLGVYYLQSYPLQKSNAVLLDSSEFFLKKTIIYSENLFYNKIKAQKNLSIVYYYKKNFSQAEKILKNIISITKDSKDNTLLSEYSSANYDLGDLYYYAKKNKEALVLFKKVDSMYTIDHSKYREYIMSNYYQSKIYNSSGDNLKALEHAKIYLENLENLESNLNNETLDVNDNLRTEDLKKEMVEFEKDQRFKLILYKCFIGFSILVLLSLIGYSFKQRRDKKIANERIDELIAEFTQKKAGIVIQENLEDPSNIVLPEPTNSYTSINLDAEKENEIIRKLEYLEQKLEYLKPNFTQQIVAKKIKTNTTYLSYVVNKRFQKSFGEYSNELKINYAINEMITNPTYRKYSTQAIAESVGFKHAVSFTKSFSKRTGVSPAQFAKSLNKVK